MDPSTAFASAWASGISMYGVAAAVGLAGRADWIEAPSWLQQWWVIAVAAVLFAAEFVIDKVQAVDSAWDAIHTAIRPVAGAVIMAGADADLATAVEAILGGGLAFSAHSAKASLRALVNTSPEPVSNVAVSLGEDGLVASLLALAFAQPEIALAVTIVLAVASVATTIVLFRFLRRTWRGWGRWLDGEPNENTF